MTPTEATNIITTCVRQRTSPNWWDSHGGFFAGLVAETIAELQKPKKPTRGPSGMPLCPKCGTEEGVHGGCACLRNQPIRIQISAEEMNAEHVTVNAEDEGENE